MSLKAKLIETRFGQFLLKKRNKHRMKKNVKARYTFHSYAEKQTDTLCIVLIGYKQFFWDSFFARLERFVPENITVCLVSSGLYNKDLDAKAKERHWNYLSVKRNNVALVQNVAIKIHPEANYIYKIDEDILLTKNFFSSLKETYLRVLNDSDYKPGFVAPLIPINGYGHLRVLYKLNLVEDYTARFEKPLYAAGRTRMIENNPEVAKYMWGYNSPIPKLDELANIVASSPTSFSVCPIRFSIGAIFFSRELWKEVNGIPVHRGTGMGDDEIFMCSLASSDSYAMIVDENCVVGHLSFGVQNQAMKEFYLANRSFFDIAE